jgi:hypothetical protein
VCVCVCVCLCVCTCAHVCTCMSEGVLVLGMCEGGIRSQFVIIKMVFRCYYGKYMHDRPLYPFSRKVFRNKMICCLKGEITPMSSNEPMCICIISLIEPVPICMLYLHDTRRCHTQTGVARHKSVNVFLSSKHKHICVEDTSIIHLTHTRKYYTHKHISIHMYNTHKA